jgi:hypothetical protein
VKRLTIGLGLPAVVLAMLLALSMLAGGARPTSASPEPGQSVLVAVIGSPLSINGGGLPTSGAVGELGDFTFTNVDPATIVAGTLTGSYDTAVLNVASTEVGCTTAGLSAAAKAELNAFVGTAGKKLIIYDPECAPGVGVDYSWFAIPFGTNNPGAAGATGTLTIVEENLLSTSTSTDKHFIDAPALGSFTDAVGDMNVMVSRDPRWCVDMQGTNTNLVTGPVHTYGRPAAGGGIAIYNGLDQDSTFGQPTPPTPNGSRKIWLQELQQPLAGTGLLFEGRCVPVAPGNPPIEKDPRLSNLWLCQPVATCADPSNGIGERDLEVVLGRAITSISPKGEPQTIGSFEFQVRYDAKFVSVTVDAGPLFDRADASCSRIPGQGFVSFRCNIKGKTGAPAVGPGTLAIVRVRPTADVYSMLIPNQDNGIATQLINQGCQLSDLQGHPIKTAVCGDAELTIRYLEGDVNADCVVNVQDQQLIAFRWGSHVGNLLYNSRYDLEPAAPKKGDGDIDAKDLQVVFGRHTSPNSTCTAPHPAQDPVDPKALPATATPTPTPHPV